MARKFTLIADGDTNDPEKGLTSDSISTGGLVEPAPIEENVFTSASATTLSPSETAAAIETPTVVLASAQPFTTEGASTTVGVVTTEAAASTLSIADVARAIESSTLTAAAETFVNDVARAIESPDTLTVNALPIIVDDIARANESATLEALAQTTILYIPPLPRMGLEADTADASLSYGTDFDP